MSIKAIGIVLDASIAPPTNKLAAVVLADWCNDEGGSLYPSMKKIAEKVGVSRSQAQRIVHGFIDQRLLSVVAHAAGGKPGVTPIYQLHLDRIANLKPAAISLKTGRTSTTGRTDAAGSVDAQDGSHPCTGRVAPMHRTGRTHATQTVIEPSVEPSKEPSRNKTPPPSGFAEFWSAWPKSDRKGGKSECAALWTKAGLEIETTAIVAHVRAMAQTESWTKERGRFIPAPVVYLRGRKWDGAELREDDVPDWRATRSGISRRAAELGLPTWDEYEADHARRGVRPQFDVYERDVIAADACRKGEP